MKILFSKIQLAAAGLIVVSVMAFTFRNTPQQNAVVMPPPPPTTTQEVIDAANAFKATLSTTQVASCFLTYSLTNAAKWSNFPIGIYSNRVGITLGSLSATQLAAAKNLLKVASGTGVEGLAELNGLLAADAYLGANGGGSEYSAGNYYIALLGTPALTGTWELYFGGHHLAFANTYTNGAFVGGTPSFRGVEPFASFTQDGGTYQPLIEEKNAFAAVIASLTSAQKTTATLSASLGDIVLGPQKDWQFPTTRVGVQCSTLDATQKALVLAAIKTYVADVDTASANAIMAKYTNELNNTYIAIKGAGDMVTQGDYIRIDGPSVWIEYQAQGGVIIRSATHPHSVWRDRTSDYGGTGSGVSVKNVEASVYKMDSSPNPTTNQTTLKFTLPSDMSVKIAIYDGMGRMVKAVSKGKMPSGDNAITVDLSGLASGVYTYTLETDSGERAAKRLVKQ
jgi:hypothetical protein